MLKQLETTSERTPSSTVIFFSGAPSVTGSGASAPFSPKTAPGPCGAPTTAERLHQVALRRKRPTVPKSSRDLLESEELAINDG